jgi:hypothetical protein
MQCLLLAWLGPSAGRSRLLMHDFSKYELNHHYRNACSIFCKKTAARHKWTSMVHMEAGNERRREETGAYHGKETITYEVHLLACLPYQAWSLLLRSIKRRNLQPPAPSTFPEIIPRPASARLPFLPSTLRFPAPPFSCPQRACAPAPSRLWRGPSGRLFVYTAVRAGMTRTHAGRPPQPGRPEGGGGGPAAGTAGVRPPPRPPSAEGEGTTRGGGRGGEGVAVCACR